jgi:hypothetical protein
MLPFLAWLAAILSLVYLFVLWRFGDLRRSVLLILSAWFLVAAYLQFLSSTLMSVAIGVALQTLLAIFLMVRFRQTV